ncbi:MAG: alpha/beta hydrolase family protein [Planctomycetaceae bacterium]
MLQFSAILPAMFLIASRSAFAAEDGPARTTQHRTGYVSVPSRGIVKFRNTAGAKTIPPRFRLKDHRFSFQASYIRSSGPVSVFRVRFPSPVTTPLKDNNTVHAEYFQPQGKGPFPAVVVLHILGGAFPLSEMVANGLARRRIAALFVKLPYYGERRGTSPRRFLHFEPDVTQRNFTQAVLDIRRAAAWLANRPEVDEKQLGITGISLGGIMTALAAPAEPRFRKVAIYLGGGDLGVMVWNHQNRAATAFRKSWLARGETRASFLKKVRPVDPATYGHLLKDRRVLMVAAKDDTIVPPESTRALWESIGKKPRLVWLEAGHISAALYLYGEMERLAAFFQSESGRKPSSAR